MQKHTDYEKYLLPINHFVKATGISLSVIDSTGTDILSDQISNQICNICKNSIFNHECHFSKLYGSHEALRFGGRYTYYCPLGLTHFAIPVLRDGLFCFSVIGGPLLMVEMETFFQEDVVPRFTLQQCSLDQLNDFISKLPIVEPARVHSLAEVLFLLIRGLDDNPDSTLVHQYQSQQLQGELADYIQNKKTEVSVQQYSVDKENELMQAIVNANIPLAKRLLNDVLGDILFLSGFDFSIIRKKIIELIILFSRASIKGGAHSDTILSLTDSYLNEINDLHDIESLTYWLKEVMNQFANYVFHYADAKHADIIFRSIDYINANYMKKITLDEIANYVYLSPTYFSKIFKSEMGMNFSAYLNKLRIEKSKVLLRLEQKNVSDVGFLVGFDDQSYFSKVFKQYTGQTPLKFKQTLF